MDDVRKDRGGWTRETKDTRGAVGGLLGAALLVLGACGGSPASPSPVPSGGVLATFAVGTETFKVFVTKPSTIAQLFALRNGSSTANIPNGRIHRGPGIASYNAPYSWHLDAEDIEMAGLTAEVCDGRPSYVEQHVGEYVDVVTRYCPWGARLVALDDRR